jgi:hypothetical protein
MLPRLFLLSVLQININPKIVYQNLWQVIKWFPPPWGGGLKGAGSFPPDHTEELFPNQFEVLLGTLRISKTDRVSDKLSGLA